MSFFCAEELKEIKSILKEHIKQEKEIRDNYYVLRSIDDNTDFERNKYREIEKVLNYHIRYDGAIDKKNIDEVMLDLEELEKSTDGVFTQTNVIVSVLTAILLFLVSISTESVLLSIYLVYGLAWAYISRYVGLRKGIDTGYVWGYCLGIIGFIVVCVLPNELEKEKNVQNNSNKYDDLEKLLKLKEAGALTEEEFEIEKSKILK